MKNLKLKSMNSITTIKNDNKRLYAELSRVDESTPEGKQAWAKLADQIRANNRELRAMVSLMGSMAEPRILQYKRHKNGAFQA